MNPQGQPSVQTMLDAVETLSNIVDLEVNNKIGVSQKHELEIGGNLLTYRTVHWLNKRNSDGTLNVLKETYSVILKYLRNFYKTETDAIEKRQSIDGINALMSLVGEASYKIDRYTDIFQGTQGGSVSQTKEFQQLKEFYKEKIVKQSNTGYSWKQLMEVAGRAEKKLEVRSRAKKPRIEVEQALLDLDSVKRDSDYELFFLRKEDGSRFFDRRLMRNIKLVCEFGDDFFGDDPLISVSVSLEKSVQVASKQILEMLQEELKFFYKDYSQFKEMELASLVNRSLMALMLTNNVKNLLRNSPVKCCLQYFRDFQGFLRRILSSREYQKLVAYPPSENQVFFKGLIRMIHSMCHVLFTHAQGITEYAELTDNLIEEGRKVLRIKPKSDSFLELIENSYRSIGNRLEHHPNGPLFKTLDLLLDDELEAYDPLVLQNHPRKLYDLYLNGKELRHLYLPSPTRQEYINHAFILDEFLGLLRSYNEGSIKKKHLMINLQDRTSWREYARCHSLEELQMHAEHANHLTVVTLSKDTDFYHQLSHYTDLYDAKAFMEQLSSHLVSESSGFYFPKKVKGELFSGWTEKLITLLHTQLFAGKRNLSRFERLDFIEVFYLFLQLKLIENTQPDSISFTCKDGVDAGACANTQFFIFYKLLMGQFIDDEEKELIYTTLFTPSLMVRERCVEPERLGRLCSAVKFLEGIPNRKKCLGNLYDELFDHPFIGKINLPKYSRY